MATDAPAREPASAAPPDPARPGAPPGADAGPGPGAASGAPPHGSLLQQLSGLWRELPRLLSDRVELLALELQRAAQALAQLLVLGVLMAVLGLAAWLALWAAVAATLVAAGLPLPWALLLVLLAHLLGLWLLWRALKSRLPLLGLPATRRHLRPRPPGPDSRPGGSPGSTDDHTAAAHGSTAHPAAATGTR